MLEAVHNHRYSAVCLYSAGNKKGPPKDCNPRTALTSCRLPRRCLSTQREQGQPRLCQKAYVSLPRGCSRFRGCPSHISRRRTHGDLETWPDHWHWRRHLPRAGAEGRQTAELLHCSGSPADAAHHEARPCLGSREDDAEQQALTQMRG